MLVAWLEAILGRDWDRRDPRAWHGPRRTLRGNIGLGGYSDGGAIRFAIVSNGK